MQMKGGNTLESIKLTEEHKSKLLEMCKVLFPEYTCWGFSGYMAKAVQFKEVDKDNWEAIQWFEFCMTHLATKLDSLRNREYLIHGPCFVNAMHSNHPVNYLYKQFKSLKT